MRLSTKRLFLILIVLLAMGNGGLLVGAWWTNMQWEEAMFGMARYAGAMQAGADFHNGVLRLYLLSANTPAENTGRKDGPFEVWTWTYYPDLGHPHEFAERQFVEMYNEKMRYMHAHPERFGPNDNEGAHNETTQPSYKAPPATIVIPLVTDHKPAAVAIFSAVAMIAFVKRQTRSTVNH